MTVSLTCINYKITHVSLKVPTYVVNFVMSTREPFCNFLGNTAQVNGRV